MLRFLEEHGRFRRVMERVNRVLMGGASDPRARVQAAMLATAIAGAVIHPLVAGPRRREPSFRPPEAGAEAAPAPLTTDGRSTT